MIIDEIQEIIIKNNSFRGYIKYIHNPELMICTLKPLMKIPSTIVINKTERYVLHHPAETLFGKECYWLLKGYPMSITCKFYQTLKPNVVFKETLKEKVLRTVETIKDFNDNDLLELEINDVETDNLMNNWITEYDKTGKRMMDSQNHRVSQDFLKFLQLKIKDYGFLDDYLENKEIETITFEKLVIPLFHTAQDFETFVQSAYNDDVLKRKTFTTSVFAIFLLSICLSTFITYTFVSYYFNSLK